MKSIMFTAAAAGLLFAGATMAQAQQSNNAAAGNNNQAVATTNANAAMPAKGSNSFTMAEAQGRIQKQGFTNVSSLTKDSNGVWRGQAQKNGNMVPVWLDYKGNIGQGQ